MIWFVFFLTRVLLIFLFPCQAQLSLAKENGPGAKLSHMQGEAAERKNAIKKLQVHEVYVVL